MFVQAGGQGCAFITAILLARSLSMTEYGYYIYGITVATILAVISTMGAGGIVARTWGRSEKIGLDRDKEAYSVQNWYFKRGLLLIVAVIFFIGLHDYLRGNINYIEFFALGFAIPFFVANVIQSFFVAKRLVVIANLIQFGLRVIMLVLAGLFIFMSWDNVAELVLVMFGIMTIYIAIVWAKNTFKYGFESEKPQGSNLSFAMMQWGLLLLSQIDIIILRFFSSSDMAPAYVKQEMVNNIVSQALQPIFDSAILTNSVFISSIAIFGVALQLSALVAFVLNAVNSNVLSHIADDYKNCTKEEFQKRITSYTRIIFILSLFAIVGLLVFGYPINSFIWSKLYTCILHILYINGRTANKCSVWLCGNYSKHGRI